MGEREDTCKGKEVRRTDMGPFTGPGCWEGDCKGRVGDSRLAR